MAYVISKTNGTQLTIVQDGAVDTNATSITLIGKNVSSFGDAQNENFVKMLENFNYDKQPRSPIMGQIWFDSALNVFRPMVFDNTNWRPLAVCLYSNTTTDTLLNAGGFNLAAKYPGDFWFDSANKQLHVFTNTGTETVLIGPEGVTGFNTTKMASTKILDNVGTPHPVIQMLLDGETIGVLSNTEFTPASLTGFSKIYRGLTFKNYSSSTRYTTATTDVVLHGLHEQLDSSYVRRNVDEHLNANWYVDTGYSLKLGTSSQAGVYWNSAASALSLNSSGSFRLEATGGTLTFNGTSLTASSSIALGAPSALLNSVYSIKVSAGSATAAGTLEGIWTLSTGSNIVPNADLANTVGTNLLRFNQVFTKHLNAGNATEQGTILGAWQLSSSSSFTPEVDNQGDLGTVAKKFRTIYVTTVANANSSTLRLDNSVDVTGNVAPTMDSFYNLGDTSYKWNNLHVVNANASVVSATSVSATVIVTSNLTATNVAVNSLTDISGTTVSIFDKDGSLVANSDGRISTQRAVKTYVDYVAQGLSNQISSSIGAVPRIPAGTVFHHAGVNAPSGYVVCDGASYQVSAYPDLFAAIGYTFGGAGGAFRVPDLRGMFIRGYAISGSVDAGRAFGSYQGDAFASHGHLFDDIRWAEVDGVYSYNDPMLGTIAVGPGAGSNRGTDYDNGVHFTKHGTYLTGDSETRPKNVALLPIIKT